MVLPASYWVPLVGGLDESYVLSLHGVRLVLCPLPVLQVGLGVSGVREVLPQAVSLVTPAATEVPSSALQDVFPSSHQPRGLPEMSHSPLCD